MSSYDFSGIEKKWVKYWDENKTFKVSEDPAVPKDKRLYVLDMFPYPSGAGLHVGHPEGYTATDIYTRYRRMQGYNVLHPMGFDSFGLPAENYAIQTGTHPAVTTKKNISRFREQIKAIGFCYDWDREVATSDPDYYKWTQWIFLQLFKKGLAYESHAPINWCPQCATGLANEEVRDGACDRCGTGIERKSIRQWVLKITAYSERLLEDLNLLDWNDSIKLMQKHWIGRSEGAEVDFTLEGSDEKIRVFTTRPDTLFGATYMVLAPEHPLVEKIVSSEQKEKIDEYILASSSKSDLQRTELNKDKTGVFTGAYAINPVNKEKIPVWISDYVLASYGTGAIMSVPAHDERDFEFAKKFDLPIIQVVSRDGTEYELNEAETVDGTAVNSGEFNGLSTSEFKKTIIDWLEKKGLGNGSVTYKLRDWIFSRQRYWGEPIPLVHCPECGIVPVPEEELPLTLPEVESYKPTGTGESPLGGIEEWVNTSCPSCKGPARRETNTMPQWAGSCWYYLRYTDPKNDQVLAARDKMEYWAPVDLYIGGAEHAVLHLLYARFWHKFLYDQGIVPGPEPFKALRNQGMILGENGEKMSKSRGNVVNPDDIIREFGADTLRLYEMFMGPLAADKPWNTQSIQGPFRFIEKIWKLGQRPMEDPENIPEELLRIRHKTVKIVTEKLAALEFNTAISQLMVYTTSLQQQKVLPGELFFDLIRMMHPFTPFVTEELWEKTGHDSSILFSSWPEWDPALVVDDSFDMPVQVNGKLRDLISMPRDASKEEMEKGALSSEKAGIYLKDKTVIKKIIVPNKLINFVVK